MAASGLCEWFTVGPVYLWSSFHVSRKRHRASRASAMVADMDKSLLEQPLVMASPRLTPSATPAEAARLRALDPSVYWLEIARELTWDHAPTVGLEGHAR